MPYAAKVVRVEGTTILEVLRERRLVLAKLGVGELQIMRAIYRCDMQVWTAASARGSGAGVSRIFLDRSSPHQRNGRKNIQRVSDHRTLLWFKDSDPTLILNSAW